MWSGRPPKEVLTTRIDFTYWSMVDVKRAGRAGVTSSEKGSGGSFVPTSLVDLTGGGLIK